MPDEQPRVAGEDDADTVTELLVGAFYDDPVWGRWAFPDAEARREQSRPFWRLFVDGALPSNWVWLAAGDAATSLWIPPGATDLSEEQEAMLEPLLVEAIGPGARHVVHALELFEAEHPRDEPHYYLSLLGTDPARRGHGHGLNLLADNLRRIDAEGVGAYLEASNPVNIALYERHGFEVAGSIDVPAGGPTVRTMWRSPRPKADG